MNWAKMGFAPANEPRRVRKRREALQRRAAVDVEPLPAARATLEVRIAPDGSVSMPHAAFAALDYGRVCKMLGLSPSRPRASRSKLAR